MRLLVDVHGLAWDEAWDDHHADLHLHQPHAAARGAGDLAGAAVRAAAAAPHADHLPDQRAASWTRLRAARPDDGGCCPSVSLIDETHGRRVRMGHLAFVGSHKVNGVSALHTDLMKQDRVPRPARALSRTASSTRPTASPSARWLHQAIPGLTEPARARRAATACSTIPTQLRGARAAAPTTPRSSERFAAVKRANKEALARLIARAARHQRRSGGAVRRADQAHPRIQAPAAQHPRDDRAVPRDPRRAASATGCRG